MLKHRFQSVWMHASLAIVLILAVASTIACAWMTSTLSSNSETEYFTAGVEASNQGDYEQAISNFTKAIELDPTLAKAYFARGDVYYLRGKYEQAIADFSRAIERDYRPEAQVYSARGDAYLATGNYAQAGEDYAEAYVQNDEYPKTYYPDRVETYSRAIELNPQLASAYYARGWASYFTGDLRQANEDYSTAIELHHEPLSEVYLARGIVNSALGQYQQAVTDFTSAIELNPGSSEAYADRGDTHVRLANYEEAISDLGTAIKIDPDFARAHNNLCWWGSLLGKVREVMESCERAVELQPDIPAYRDSRGLARALNGDYAGAIEDFRFYVEAVKSRGFQDDRREYWLSELEAGRNPFDEATLQELLNE